MTLHRIEQGMPTGYFLPPTCPDCHGTLDSDGNHWASSEPECPQTHENARLRASREREYHQAQEPYDHAEGEF